MRFLSKAELKKQLQLLGVKVEGNYVRKKDIRNFIKADAVRSLEKKFEQAMNDLEYLVFVGSAGASDEQFLNIDSDYLIAVPKGSKLPNSTTANDWVYSVNKVSITKPDTNLDYYGNNAFIPLDKADISDPHKVFQHLEALKNKFLISYDGKIIPAGKWEPKV